MLLPLTHKGRDVCAVLLRLLVGAELPSQWLTGPVEAPRLPVLLWEGRLDIELRPESDRVPKRRKVKCFVFQCNVSFNLNNWISWQESFFQYWLRPEKVSCLFLLSEILSFSRGQRMRSRLLCPVFEDDVLWGCRGLKKVERASDFSAVVYKLVKWHTVRDVVPFVCFHT